MSPFAVFFIFIHPLLDSPNNRLPYTSSGLDLTQGIALLKEGNDSRMVGRKCGPHEGMKERKKG
jgi:hypothetical protein